MLRMVSSYGKKKKPSSSPEDEGLECILFRKNNPTVHLPAKVLEIRLAGLLALPIPDDLPISPAAGQ